ncbi:Cobalt-zinc-cadmium resistance protein CzcA [Pirellulimonas nuda]|uniref:Cobalt-zinc-cadmium resistance protein CzcA n=1 Tax=Pirellulimonas nuda TaxID=2528009 RepID=A0A518D5G7_9BACT|nr:efflux RND transporter permease subunit [Pirellulimonas nuda]QDU86713.1 Cobalt-zinc-cadmium resistance protein CzcA [Pirellulimonas nuda]
MTSLFYDNRRLLVLAILLIVVAGLNSFYVLPRMEDPVLKQRAAIVNTLYAGAKPERVEALVTERLEEELKEIAEIKELRSTSRTGISTIVIELRDDVYQVDEVWSRVRDKLDDARPLLPVEASHPDFDMLEVSAYATVVALTWELPSDPSYAILRRRAEELERRLRAVPGTREVDTFGDPTEEVRVEVRQDDLAMLGLSARDVADAVAASDAKAPAGLVRTGEANLLMEVDSELDSLSRIGGTPIQYGADGRFVRLADVADVSKGIKDPPASLAIVSGKPAVALGALVRGDQRIDLWAADAREVIEQFRSELPRGVGLRTVFDQSPYVEQRLETLLWNLMVGAGAVMLVIWVMMGWRSALVVGAALPLASLMVLGGMRFLGIPIHQMSVTGLIIALGLLIDNAIVMVDEVRDRLSHGVSGSEAVSRAVKHLAVPLFGSTVTTWLSFAPIALMPGPAGEFVGSIAISVILAVGSSFLLAMAITPALAAIALPAGGGPSRAWWSSGIETPQLARGYRWALGVVLRWPALGVGIGILFPVMGYALATTLTEQFFPPAERDQFQVQMDLPASASLEATDRIVRRATDLMLAHPEIEGVDWFLGESAPSFYYNMLANRAGTPQYAQALVKLRQVEGSREVIQQVQQQLDERLTGARFLVKQLEQGPPFEAPIEVRLFGPDLARLQSLGEEVRQMLTGLPDVVHTTSNLAESLPKLSLEVDENEARLAGLDNLAIARQLDATLEGAVGGSILEDTENIPVRVRVSNAHRSSLADVASLDLTTPTGRLPLSAIASVELRSETAAIPHFDTERMNEVKAYITAGVLPAQVLSAFRERLAQSGFELPPGYRFEYGGETSKRNDAIGNLLSSVSVLAVLMAATLVLSFGSFRLAALIASVGVLSIGLGVGSLALFGYPFGFMAIVGTMGLAGVAINDSIVVLAALREDPRARTGDPDAARDVVMHATRHVLSTTFTTVAGFLPLLLGGGGFWPPLATSISGGVLGGTLLALVFVPSAHTLLMCRGRARCAAEQDPACDNWSSINKASDERRVELLTA